jgi:hypothetical protein
MNLADPAVRADLTERLMARYAGRPTVLGPGILAARTEFVAWVREVGGTALVLSTAHGPGPSRPTATAWWSTWSPPTDAA